MSATLPPDNASLDQAVWLRPAWWRPMVTLVAYCRRELSERGLLGLWRVALLYCGVLWHWPAHRALVRVMGGPSTQALREAYPRLEYRYTLPYLSLHFCRQERYEMLRAHYALLNDRLTPAFAREVLDGSMCLWTREMDGRQMAIVFKGHCLQTRHREGELTLALTLDGVSLYELSFSFVSASSIKGVSPALGIRSEHVVYVGRVQGAVGQYEGIRQVTKWCSDIAPPDLLMATLAGLATAMGIDALVGVDNDSSISHETIRSAGTSFDYSAFWSRYGAEIADGKHAVVALPFAEKPLAAIDTRHRKRTLLKRGFKKSVALQAQQVLEGFFIQA